MADPLIRWLARVEQQGKVSNHTSLQLRSLIKKVRRAAAHKQKQKVQELVAEICEIIIESNKR